MSTKRESVVEQLSALSGTEELVRIRRSIRKADPVEGFVVGVGQRWVLVHVLNPSMFLDGYTAIRLKDIRRVERRGGGATFPLRALRYFGASPGGLEGVTLDKTEEVLRSLGSQFPLLTVHVEERDPSVCYIGKLVGVSKRTLCLHEINPDAAWDDKATKWPLDEITRVEAGGRYEEALHAVGGEPSG